MNNIEQLHLDAIRSKVFYDERKFQIDGDWDASLISAQITEQIAIEYGNWLDVNLPHKELFKEFLKTKEK